MKLRSLFADEMAAHDATHAIIVKASDLTEAAANTAQVIPITTVVEGQIVSVVKSRVKTAFKDADDAAFDSTTFIVGDTGDTDRLLASQQVNANGTTVGIKAGTTTRHAPTADTVVNLTVGSMAAKALANLDVGEAEIFLKIEG